MRLVILLALTVVLAGCVTPAPTLAPEAAPQFQPVAFFLGETRGVGRLVVIGRSRELVRVRSIGMPLAGGGLRLKQTITFGMNRQEEREWTLEPSVSGGYVASLTEASGDVQLFVDGNVLRIRYGLGAGVRVDQDLWLQPEGQTALNRATIRFFGVPIGRLEETIWRVSPEEANAKRADPHVQVGARGGSRMP